MTDTHLVTPRPDSAPPPATSPARPRLIATDLDGTLLRDDKTISARTLAALDAAARADIGVVFVTGRSARWIDVVTAVDSRSLAICSNGAIVIDLHTGHHPVRIRPLDEGDALRVAENLRALDPLVSFALERAAGVEHEPRYPVYPLDHVLRVAPVEVLLNDGRAVPGDQRDTLADGWPGQSPETPWSPDRTPDTGVGPTTKGGAALKLLAHHPTADPDEFLRLATRAAGDRAHVTRSGPSPIVEISAPGVTKATTLAMVCAERGILPEEVMAFGDMPNDLEMLAWAGHSYAMANAHPEVLALPGQHTGANQEDGVAAAVERVLAGL